MSPDRASIIDFGYAKNDISSFINEISFNDNDSMRLSLLFSLMNVSLILSVKYTLYTINKGILKRCLNPFTMSV